MTNALALQKLEEKLGEAANHVAAKVSTGEWTEAQGRAYMRDLQAQAAKAILGVEEKTGLTPKSTDPRKADPIDKPALTLYADSLRRDGMNDKQILQLLQEAAAAPETAIQVQVEKERALQQGEADAIATRKYEATPEGLREFAAAERARQEVETSQLADADTILGAKGFSPDDVAALSPAERLRYSGVNPDAADPDAGSHMPPSRFVEGS